MYKLGKYKPSDMMSDLVCDNYPTLQVMSRFGIALGFGDKTIDEVCASNGVDTATFLAVVNMMLDNEPLSENEYDAVSVEALLQYMHNSHNYFLEFRLPAIRRKLVDVLDSGQSDLSFVIMRFFDDYVAEVRKHMMYEERRVVPYVRALAGGSKDRNYDISAFERQHDAVEMKMTELKNILIKYYPAEDHNELNGVLFDIFSGEADLASHNSVENNLLVPLVKRLERKIDSQR